MNDADFWKVNIFEHIKMMIARYNIIGIGGDGTIGKFIAVRIDGDEIEAVSRFDGNHKWRDGKKIPQAIGIFLAMKRGDNFLVLQNDRSRGAEKEPSFQQILKYGVIWAVSGERFDKNIRVNNDSQGYYSL